MPRIHDEEGRVAQYSNDAALECNEVGNPGVNCNAPAGLPFGLNTKWRSPLTGFVNMHHRWYSPRMGEFLSHDPLGYIDLYNLYGFGGYDPLNNYDPEGTKIKGLVGGASEAAEETIKGTFNQMGHCLLGGPLLGPVCVSVTTGDQVLDEAQKGKTLGEKVERGINTLSPMDDAIIDTQKTANALAQDDYHNAGKNGLKALLSVFGMASMIQGGLKASRSGKKTTGNKKTKLDPKCFQAGTLVDTPDGERRIEDIEVGDLVWAFDFEYNERVARKVNALFVGSTNSWVHIQVEDGSEIVSTTSHKIWVESEGAWLKAEKLLPEMKLRTSEGQIAQIISLFIEDLEFAEQTYNFEVDGEHNYFVGNLAILVHNQTSSEHPKILGTKLSGANAHESAKIIQLAQAKKIRGAVRQRVGGLIRLDIPVGDITLPGNQPHVHGVDAGGNKWSINLDGTLHDAGANDGTPSRAAKQALQDAGWGGGC